MKGDDLDKDLARLRESPIPDSPSDLRTRVWRSIRDAQGEPERRRWVPSFWPDWMLRPGFAAAFLTITFGLGVFLGSARAREEPSVAAVSDYPAFLDVFHERGPGSPYDRLFY